MKVEVKEVEQLIRELSVEVEPATVNSKMEEKFAEVRKEAQLKGFRKGKVPMDIIRKSYGDEVKADAVDELIKSTYPEAVREKELRVATPPEITNLDFTDEGGLAYTARVEVLPTIEKVDFDGLEITGFDIEVSDEEVDQALHQIRKANAEQRPVEREIQPDDAVVADLKKTDDPKMAIAEDSFPDALIDLSSPGTVREFREKLPGLKAGDTTEVEVTYEDNYPDQNFAGATIRYEVTVKEVREQMLPEADDALAKSTGQAETLLELKMKIREDLKRQKQDEIRRLNKNEIVGQICQKNQVPVPNRLVQDYVKAMVEDVKQNNPDADEAQLHNSYQGVAVNTLRWNLLYNELARLENIQISREDTDKVIKRFAENYGITEQQAAEALQKSGKVSSLRDTLIEEKVLDLLIGRAKVVKREPEGTGKKD